MPAASITETEVPLRTTGNGKAVAWEPFVESPVPKAATKLSGATVAPVRGQSSHRIGSLARANCLVVVPEETTSIAAGETVNALVLDRTF